MWSLTAGAALSGLPWTSFLTSLNISFSCCEMGIINPMFIVWIEGDDANCFAQRIVSAQEKAAFITTPRLLSFPRPFRNLDICSFHSPS